MSESVMPGLIVLAEGEAIASAVGFAALCVSVAVSYSVVEWRKARQAQIEADMKREMIQKGLPADDIERVSKASTPTRKRRAAIGRLIWSTPWTNKKS